MSASNHLNFPPHLGLDHSHSNPSFSHLRNTSRTVCAVQSIIMIIFFGLFSSSSRVVAASFKSDFTAKNFGLLQSVNPQSITSAEQQLRVDKLLKLIQQRLLIAHDVARWKWNHKRPIEDRKREQELLLKVRQQATIYSLDPNMVATFFQAQIEAGKLIQAVDFQTWKKQGIKSFPHVPDLNQILRPSLGKLNTEFLFALTELTQFLGCSQIQELIKSRSQVIIQGDGIVKQVQSIAISPLLQFQSTSCSI
ncbi:gamma subclass chorismate mutase AroQ [Nostoc sp. FACHB-145]|uniref:gamma subclass chorismate mutase AroQ n=1 Tax=Nostoc sp. FACHB-145 TaxID=2692836 RepID=UPI001682E8AF|nr:gamma subclass chorismate mutase AroQ [Nostoc sp. FACHB-145]MBD2471518.1 gamma subclass chorismate mutase AroQ [Nostoc sp. FACHB-145]